MPRRGPRQIAPGAIALDTKRDRDRWEDEPKAQNDKRPEDCACPLPTHRVRKPVDVGVYTSIRIERGRPTLSVPDAAKTKEATAAFESFKRSVSVAMVVSFAGRNRSHAASWSAATTAPRTPAQTVLVGSSVFKALSISVFRWSMTRSVSLSPRAEEALRGSLSPSQPWLR